MKKIETIWHHILIKALEEKQFKHTQKQIAGKFGYSLSTVNYALEKPTAIGAIRKSGWFFVLEDFKKLLYFWATRRNLGKDIFYKTKADGTVGTIEGQMFPEAVFAGYSAGKRLLSEAPADYSKVYFYANPQDLDKIMARFPVQKGEPNVFALTTPPSILDHAQLTDLSLTFVDTWNLKDWYAKDFTLALEQKIDGVLS
ncbi:MAG: hypothetical protein ABH814_01500 [bacterium]